MRSLANEFPMGRGSRVRARGWPVAASIAVLAVLLTRTVPGFADWPPYGFGFCTEAGDQDAARLVSDGAGGALIAWQDFRPGAVDVFAQHVLAAGGIDPAWPSPGRGMLGDPAALSGALGGQALPAIAPDGGGGAIVAWQDDRDDPSGADIYAQHVLAAGVLDPAWPPNGLALCKAAGLQDVPVIIPDGAGGAIVSWMDGRSGGSNPDIYAQHVLVTGQADPTWPVNGVAVCTAPAPQAFPQIAADGRGGAIITWYDFRPSPGGIDIYAQHVEGAGVVDPAWPVNGRALCTAAGTQQSPMIVADGIVPAGGPGGAIVTWQDSRDGVDRIYAQRVLGTGTIAPGWPVDGRAMCAATGPQTDPIPVSDGGGGAIVAWRDLRNVHNPVVFAQHVLAAGAVDPGWPADGVAPRLSTSPQTHHAAVSDGAGGAFLVWQETFDVIAHHVLASGALDPGFPLDGRPVVALPSMQRSPVLLASAPGEAIAAWTDDRSGRDVDLYALPLSQANTVATERVGAPGVATLDWPLPNPSSQRVRLRFSLAHDADVRLDIFDLTGRRVRRLRSGLLAAAGYDQEWDLHDALGHRVPGGVYLAVLAVDGAPRVGRIVTVAP